MSDKDTSRLIGEHLGALFAPLQRAFSGAEAAKAFFLRMGWLVDDLPPEYGTVATDVEALLAVVEQLRSSSTPSPALLEDVLGRVRSLYTSLGNLTAPTGVDAARFLQGLANRLVAILVGDYLSDRLPSLYSGLVVLGVIRNTPRPAEIVNDVIVRPAYIEREILYSEIPAILSDPGSIPQRAVGWGTTTFAFERLAGALLNVFNSIGLDASLDPVDDIWRAGFGVSPEDRSTMSTTLTLSFGDAVVAGVPVDLDIGIFDAPVEPGHPLPGIVVQPLIPSLQTAIQLGANTTLTVQGGLDLRDSFGVFIRPQEPLELRFPFVTGGSLPSGGFSVEVAFAPPEPSVLIGSKTGSRLEATGARSRVLVDLVAGDLRVAAEVEALGLKGVVKGSEGDGFVNKLLEGREVQVQLPSGVRWSSREGIALIGSAGFAVTLTPNLTIGPLQIDTFSLAVTAGPAAGGPALVASAAAAITAVLGPVTAVVDGIGVQLVFTFEPGNAGPFDYAVRFKPPTGIGIFIESSSVSGGGFLFFDEPKGRYGGALELRAYSIDIKAFGLIETKVPGVSFSFVIVISAEFNPIQLGFGFTLDGVGGLIGINRTVNSDEVSKKLRDGTVDNILFPTNLIQNAPQIISDLAALFPAADSRYVFGPLAKLGWAGLVHGTIGVILELPSKAVTIIGNINAILPKPDNALVVIDMDIAGKLDFPKKHFELDATLSPNSKLGAYTITGDMATRIDFGDRPNFAISMGGFHSQFKPPPGFPRLRRMAIDLGIKGNPSVTLQGFMALTSNTAQVGAQLDIYASFGATLTGNVGFEAMFVFSPFSFDARLWGSVHVDFLGVGFGMTLDGRITGPSPWTIDGEVCVSLWFDSACVGIHKKLDGAPAPQTLPLLDPWFGFPSDVALSAQEVPGLKPAIKDPRNWAGRLPAGALIGVSYVERKGREELVDPVGIATLRQKSVPFAYNITQYAGRAPSRKGMLNITSATVGGVGASADYVTDWFAPGQYRKMGNDEALAAQPFEQLKAGVELQGKVAKVGSSRPRAIEYRTLVLDAQGNEVQAFNHMLPPRHLDGIQKSSSVARLSARLSGRTRFIDITQKRRMTDEIESFSLTSKVDLTLVGGIAKVTRSEAAAALDALAGSNAFKRQQYQIVGFHVVA